MNKSENIIVSLTTISSRIKNLSLCLKSLLDQNYLNYEIHLNISSGPYLIDKGISRALVKKTIPSGVKVFFVENSGPYRKLIPTLSRCGANDTIITVDDDVIYPNTLISTLTAANKIYDCPIAYRGREITCDSKKIANYGYWKKTALTGSGMAKLPTGKDGVLYKKRYFHSNVFNIELAQKLAPTTDDLWFKWHTALNGYPSVLIFNNLDESFNCIEDVGDNLFESFNKHTNNDIVVSNLESYMKSKMHWTLHSEILSDE